MPRHATRHVAFKPLNQFISTPPKKKSAACFVSEAFRRLQINAANTMIVGHYSFETKPIERLLLTKTIVELGRQRYLSAIADGVAKSATGSTGLMSAYGTKQTFVAVRIYVRFRG